MTNESIKSADLLKLSQRIEILVFYAKQYTYHDRKRGEAIMLEIHELERAIGWYLLGIASHIDNCK